MSGSKRYHHAATWIMSPSSRLRMMAASWPPHTANTTKTSARFSSRLTKTAASGRQATKQGFRPARAFAAERGLLSGRERSDCGRRCAGAEFARIPQNPPGSGARRLQNAECRMQIAESKTGHYARVPQGGVGERGGEPTPEPTGEPTPEPSGGAGWEPTGSLPRSPPGSGGESPLGNPPPTHRGAQWGAHRGAHRGTHPGAHWGAHPAPHPGTAFESAPIHNDLTLNVLGRERLNSRPIRLTIRYDSGVMPAVMVLGEVFIGNWAGSWEVRVQAGLRQEAVGLLFGFKPGSGQAYLSRLEKGQGPLREAGYDCQLSPGPAKRQLADSW